jgi:hypothetical protein
MKVIGAGFPRTGTLSTKAALEHLGFGPCYHFVTLFERPQDAEVWLAAARGRPVDWMALFADFGCAVDWPQSACYKQLMDVYPQAKVLLNVRDPEQWYESMASTVYAASRSALSAPAGTMMNNIGQAIDALGWQGIFQGRFEAKEHALALYAQWNQDVKDYVPAERLLVWEVTDGWEPLCRFLGVAVPDVPFPRLNEREAFPMLAQRAQEHLAP